MTALAIHKQALSLDWLYRWLVIAATAVVAGIGLFVTRVSIDDNFLRQASIIMLLPLAMGFVFNILASRLGSLSLCYRRAQIFSSPSDSFWPFRSSESY
jgi:hypothetical protein